MRWSGLRIWRLDHSGSQQFPAGCMERLIVLGTGPLGMIVRAPSKPQIVRCLTWLKTIQATGAVVIILDIAHYEVRRELLRPLRPRLTQGAARSSGGSAADRSPQVGPIQDRPAEPP